MGFIPGWGRPDLCVVYRAFLHCFSADLWHIASRSNVICCRLRIRLGKTRSVCQPWGAPTRWTSTACSRSMRTLALLAPCKGNSTLWLGAHSRLLVLVQFLLGLGLYWVPVHDSSNRCQVYSCTVNNRLSALALVSSSEAEWVSELAIGCEHPVNHTGSPQDDKTLL